MNLGPVETEVVGGWQVIDGRPVEDEASKRIRQLVQNHLRKIAVDPSGWDGLYQDPSDGRFWELVYPQSEMHGGGPPTLRCLAAEQVHQKYRMGT